MSTVVEHLPRNGSMKLTMDRGVNRYTVFSILAHHPHKIFVRLETLNPQNQTKLDANDTTILSHHPYILCHFANYALCLLALRIGGLWKAAWWVVLVVHIDVHGEELLVTSGIAKLGHTVALP